MQSQTSEHRPKSGRLAAVAVGATLALATGQLGVGAVPVPHDRGIERACDDRAQGADQFADVDPGGVHAGAIDCLWVYRVVQGRWVVGPGNVYDPGSDVTRQQMASFVANALDRLPDRRYALPMAGDDLPFEDAHTISSAHQRHVDRLHAAAIVSGYPDGTFRPGASINRAQMASLVARAIEEVTGADLPRTPIFDDVSGVHQASIEKLTAIGVVQGRSADLFEPAAATTRAQMATFIARTLDYLVAEGFLVPVAFARGTAGATLGITQVATGVHETFDRVTFTLEGHDGLAGWDLRYVDEPLEHGSGHHVEVAGDATLELMLTGMAFPPAFDEELWDDRRISVEGDGIVEIVDRGVFEGRQQLFIGTTGLNDVSVDQLTDPQRVYVDVDHNTFAGR